MQRASSRLAPPTSREVREPRVTHHRTGHVDRRGPACKNAAVTGHRGGPILASVVRGSAAVLALGTALVIVALPMPATGTHSWADVSQTAWVVDRAAGLALVLAGIAALWLPRPAWAGPAAIAAGLCWLGQAVAGSEAPADTLRAIGLFATQLVLPLVAFLVVVLSEPAGITRRTRRLLVALFGGIATLTLIRLLTYVPFDDPHCWVVCAAGSNPFVVGGGGWDALQRVATVSHGVVTLAGAAGLAAWSVGRLARRPRQRRLTTRLLPLGGAIVGVSATAWALAVLVVRADPPEPSDVPQGLGWAWWAEAAGLLVVAAGIGVVSAVAIRRATALRDVLAALAAAAPVGGLQASLVTALGDPTLTVRYPLEEPGRWVDGTGQDVAGEATGDPAARVATAIERGGRTVAVVEQDAGPAGGASIREIGAAARLAVDNERLRAVALARVAELRASRGRIVAAGDEERRRLERDLHDGAQQRLLALTFELRVARADADARGDAGLAGMLARAEDLARVAIEELRQVAHGIHPAILVDTGLAAALGALSDDAPVPLELRFEPDPLGRCDPTVEIAAYHLVVEALARSEAAGATHLEVRVRRAGGMLTVDIDGHGRADLGDGTVLRSADRVGAAGGLLQVLGPGHVRAELPCA